jgi:TPR repeat protein
MKWWYQYQLNSLLKKAARLYKVRQSDTVTKAEIDASVKVHMQLAALYKRLRFNKNFPHAAEYELENYRIVATLENTDALYLLGLSLFERAKFWRSLSTTLYANKIQNKYATGYFEEALVYLQAANERNHAKAKRELGMAYIQGLGLTPDKDKGLQLVVDSIELENAWDKASEIFEQLGLNKPEFFSAILSKRSGNTQP